MHALRWSFYIPNGGNISSPIPAERRCRSTRSTRSTSSPDWAIAIRAGSSAGELILSHNARKEKGELERAADGTDLFVRPEASTIVDLTAFVAITDALKLRLGVFNLTDEKYAFWSDVRGLRTEDAGILDAFTRPGRNVSVSASYRF